MMFHVGQMVVCVDDSDTPGFLHVCDLIKKGCVYTIRGFDEGQEVGGGPAVLLEEVRPPLMRWHDGTDYEPGFRMSRFRPVKKTDIGELRRVMETLPMLPQDVVA